MPCALVFVCALLLSAHARLLALRHALACLAPRAPLLCTLRDRGDLCLPEHACVVVLCGLMSNARNEQLELVDQ